MKLIHVLVIMLSCARLDAMQDMGRFFMMVNTSSDATNKKLLGGAIAGSVSGGSVAAVGTCTGNPRLFFCGMGTMFASQMGTSSTMLCDGKTPLQPTNLSQGEPIVTPPVPMETTAWLSRHQKPSEPHLSLPGSVTPEPITQ